MYQRDAKQKQWLKIAAALLTVLIRLAKCTRDTHRVWFGNIHCLLELFSTRRNS